MSVESAADLAGMFDEDEFAEAAEYTGPAPGAMPEPCSVIVDRGQGRGRFQAGERDVQTSERHLWVQSAELGSVQRDGSFAMLDAEGAPTGEAFTVQGLPKLDHTAGLWSVELLIAS